MELSLKSIKHSEFASQETHCYEATLYLDNKPLAYVGNQGCGGPDFVYPHKKFKGDYQATMKEIRNHFDSLPPMPFSYEGFDGNMVHDSLSQTLETWCNDQVTDFLHKKDMQRVMRGKHLFKTSEGLFEVRHEVKVEQIKRDYPDAIILNDLPVEKALEIYKGAVS